MLIILYSVEAVEYDELDTFLRLKESWNPNYDDTPKLEVVPIGVPGASSPSQMTNHKPYVATSPSPSPLKDKSKKGKEHDAGLLLEDRVLEGIQVTDTELEDLVKELGLEGDEAGDLVKGLSFSSDREPVTPLAHKTALPAEDHILSNPVKELDPVASTEDTKRPLSPVKANDDQPKEDKEKTVADTIEISDNRATETVSVSSSVHENDKPQEESVEELVTTKEEALPEISSEQPSSEPESVQELQSEIEAINNTAAAEIESSEETKVSGVTTLEVPEAEALAAESSAIADESRSLPEKGIINAESESSGVVTQADEQQDLETESKVPGIPSAEILEQSTLEPILEEAKPQQEPAEAEDKGKSLENVIPKAENDQTTLEPASEETVIPVTDVAETKAPGETQTQIEGTIEANDTSPSAPSVAPAEEPEVKEVKDESTSSVKLEETDINESDAKEVEQKKMDASLEEPKSPKSLEKELLKPDNDEPVSEVLDLGNGDLEAQIAMFLGGSGNGDEISKGLRLGPLDSKEPIPTETKAEAGVGVEAKQPISISQVHETSKAQTEVNANSASPVNISKSAPSPAQIQTSTSPVSPSALAQNPPLMSPVSPTSPTSPSSQRSFRSPVSPVSSKSDKARFEIAPPPLSLGGGGGSGGSGSSESKSSPPANGKDKAKEKEKDADKSQSRSGGSGSSTRQKSVSVLKVTRPLFTKKKNSTSKGSSPTTNDSGNNNGGANGNAAQKTAEAYEKMLLTDPLMIEVKRRRDTLDDDWN